MLRTYANVHCNLPRHCTDKVAEHCASDQASCAAIASASACAQHVTVVTSTWPCACALNDHVSVHAVDACLCQFLF